MKGLAQYTVFLILTLSLFQCNGSTETRHPDSEVQLFAPGVISSADHDEFDIAFSSDESTIYFTRRKDTGEQNIYRSELTDRQWQEPEIASFSLDRDKSPYITPDGNYLFFGSQRPIPGLNNLGTFDMNIWMMQRQGNQWSEPAALPNNINAVQQHGEQWPSSSASAIHSADGKDFYYSAMYRDRAGVELYKTRFSGLGFTNPSRITGLFPDSRNWINSPSLSPDGEYLVFHSHGIVEGYGADDIYISKRDGPRWLPAINIGNQVNTAGHERSAKFSPDGAKLFFSRADILEKGKDDQSDIYFIETDKLNLDTFFRSELKSQ